MTEAEAEVEYDDQIDYCYAYPVLEALTGNETPSPTDHQFTFSIKFSATTIVYVVDHDGDEHEAESWSKDHTIYIKRENLLGDNNTYRQQLESTITDHLRISADSYARINLNILDCARDMIRKDLFGNNNIWPMKVDIDEYLIMDLDDYELLDQTDEVEVEDEDEDEDDDDDEDEDEDEDDNDEILEMVPTIVREDSVNKECSVCLEELLLGSEATSLPCLHIFHGDCILNWLHQRNSCPLCRS